MSQSQSQSSVNLYHYGTEVIVNLSPDTVVQVKINDAEFIVKGKEILSVQKPENSSKIYSAEICEQEVITVPNFEYIDEVKVSERELIHRLQNSPYFCVFKYARAVKQKVWNEAENRERDWGETLKIRTVRFAYVIFVRITRFSQPRAIPSG